MAKYPGRWEQDLGSMPLLRASKSQRSDNTTNLGYGSGHQIHKASSLRYSEQFFWLPEDSVEQGAAFAALLLFAVAALSLPLLIYL
jgi:hypothetical protein